jgi:hypothetical protein
MFYTDADIIYDKTTSRGPGDLRGHLKLKKKAVSPGI